jgi:hypothetical protein
LYASIQKISIQVYVFGRTTYQWRMPSNPKPLGKQRKAANGSVQAAANGTSGAGAKSEVPAS